MNIPILFQDSRFAVLNKPAGLPVHAGPSGGPNVENFFPSLSRRRNGPWLAHRLDADTAGCLVVALRLTALHEAQAEFAGGRAEKTYWAMVAGQPADEAGTIELGLRKHSDARGWKMLPDSAGLSATTEWRLRGRGPGTAWLELRPRTGRTHQVRVHCAALGCPILGDAVYGAGGGPLQLLARAITLRLEPPLVATAPPPVHMHAALAACGWSADQEP